jgi:hypothetical protein
MSEAFYLCQISLLRIVVKAAEFLETTGPVIQRPEPLRRRLGYNLSGNLRDEEQPNDEFFCRNSLDAS